MPREEDETWPDYIVRATDRTEELARKHNVTDWVDLQRTRKWQLIGKIASSNDSRWSLKLLTWKPWFRCAPLRVVGHPYKRWEDDVVKAVGGSWADEAKDVELWSLISAGFVHRI